MTIIRDDRHIENLQNSMFIILAIVGIFVLNKLPTTKAPIIPNINISVRP